MCVLVHDTVYRPTPKAHCLTLLLLQQSSVPHLAASHYHVNSTPHLLLFAVSYSPSDVLEPRHASLLSDFGSDSDSDDESDWDRFSSGEGSNETSEALAERKARTVEARKRETSLFGVTDKRLSAPLK